MNHFGRRIALTGIPRSGTTLCCRLLGQAPGVVSLFEPMDVASLPTSSRAEAIAEIRRFFDAAAHSLMANGSAPSYQAAGAVPDNPFSEERDASGLRLSVVRPGVVHLGAVPDPCFTLAIKHNAAFTALLPELADNFETYAIVRNPLAVLASWSSVSLPVSQGLLPAGMRLDPDLADRLANTPSTVDRQLIILDWTFARYRDGLPRERVIRYEDVVASGGGVLADVTGERVPRTVLDERNSSRLYDRSLCSTLGHRLLADEGAWRDFYGADSVRALLERLSHAPT